MEGKRLEVLIKIKEDVVEHVSINGQTNIDEVAISIGLKHSKLWQKCRTSLIEGQTGQKAHRVPTQTAADPHYLVVIRDPERPIRSI